MKNRAPLRKIGRAAAVTLSAATLATLAATPAQARDYWLLVGSHRAVTEYGTAAKAKAAAEQDLAALRPQCGERDGVVVSAEVAYRDGGVPRLGAYRAEVKCGSKRG